MINNLQHCAPVEMRLTQLLAEISSEGRGVLGLGVQPNANAGPETGERLEVTEFKRLLL